jgi:hypothetical protein
MKILQGLRWSANTALNIPCCSRAVYGIKLTTNRTECKWNNKCGALFLYFPNQISPLCLPELVFLNVKESRN